MGKIGRNAPCPCGSGKKYKKCCLKKDEEEALRTSRLLQPDPVFDHPEPNLHPYVLAKMSEDPKLTEMLEGQHGKLSSPWTPGTVAALKAEDLELKLREFGVDPSREAYLEQAKDHQSAWELSRTWADAIGDETSDEDDCLLGLGACELWKRYLPERPSIEMLDDWMQEGYEHLSEDRFVAAVDRWLELWAVLSARLTTEMTTPEDMDVLIAGSQFIGNWILDFTEILRNAAAADPKYAERGISLLEELFEKCPDWDANERIFARSELAHLHFRLGHDDVGEKLLVELVDEVPDQSIGYVCLSAELSFPRPGEDQPRDLDRAISLLEQALARPVVDPENWDVDLRLEGLREKRSARTSHVVNG